MNHLPLLRSSAVTILALGLGPLLRAADSEPAPKPKPGYTVVLNIAVDEKGTPGEISVVSSDDTTLGRVLEEIAIEEARHKRPDPRMKDGHAVKYVIRAPFVFPVDGDEGPESNLAPKPSFHGNFEAQPVYPAELAAKGETGGAMLELMIGADGSVREVTLLRSSHKDFGDAAIAAAKQWKFSPAMKDGAAVSSRWRLAVCFQTDTRFPDWEWRVAPRPSLGTYTVMHRTQPVHEQTPAVPVPPTPAPEPAK